MVIEREDLEAKLREIEEVVEETKAEVWPTSVMVGAVAALLAGTVWLFGWRKGRRAGAAVVEIVRRSR